MRYLLNAFSPTMLSDFEDTAVVFRSAIRPQAVFSNILTNGINALNPRHTTLFEALKEWGAVPPSAAMNVTLKLGDDALIILPKNANRAGTEVQTNTPEDYTYIWCGVVASNNRPQTPQTTLYEYACGNLYGLESLGKFAPTDIIEIAYGYEYDVGGVAITHSAPKAIFRGMLV